MFKLLVVIVFCISILCIGLPLNTIDLGNYNADTGIENTPNIKSNLNKEILIEKSNNFNSSKPVRISLGSKNTISLNGPIDESSVLDLQLKIMKMSNELPRNSKIYLVLYTPGGSIFEGLALIDNFKAIPQKIETITLFSASMGFEIVQNLDTRYITPSGILMSHRGAGSVSGQFDGELEQRYKLIKRQITYMEQVAADRMNLSLEDYKKLVKDEYWVSGFDAVQENAADQTALVSCGKSLSGTNVKIINSIFGPVEMTISNCPIITTPISFNFKNIKDPIKRKEIEVLLKTLYNNKIKFINDYIKTKKYFEYFK